MNAELASRNEHRTETAATLFAGATPELVIAAATQAADALKAVVRDRKLYTRIGSRDHVHIEAWQTLGALVGVFAVRDSGVAELAWPTVEALPDEPPQPGPEPRKNDGPEVDAWKAAEALHAEWRHHGAMLRARGRGLAYGYTASFHAVKGGEWIGWAEGRCDRNERAWVSRDDYALSSMAQTRGQSRALAAPLRFVVELAGYAGTPADDMAGAPAGPTGAEVAAAVETAVAEALERERATAEAAGAQLDADAELELVTALQTRWPGVEAHGFIRALARRLELPGIPETAALTLRAWAWWTEQPAATGNVRDSEPVSPSAEQDARDRAAEARADAADADEIPQ